MTLRQLDTVQTRQRYIADRYHTSFQNIFNSLRDDESQVHCENLIGAITIPLGIAGPVVIRNKRTKQKKQFSYIPLATTEGALVASVSRGLKVISLSGGADVIVHKSGATRGPVFLTGSLKKSMDFLMWLEKNTPAMRKQLQSTSKHLVFKQLVTKVTGPYVYVRIQCDTKDAMGMNMITLATAKLVRFIETKTKYQCLSIAGNFDIDKKPAYLNMLMSRGYECWAEVLVKKEVIARDLKTTPARLYETWVSKCMIGSALSGSFGSNAHYANIVAAFFAATGQDLGHIVEGSMGITTMRMNDDSSLTISVYLPSILVGTIGGGTQLKTQQEAQHITNTNSTSELCEVLIVGVLAGELSLLASLSEGSLAKAHRSLGR